MNKIYLLIVFIFITSCAESKVFRINGKHKLVEPYGWMNQSDKDNKTRYKMSTGNIIWSVIFCQTVFVPLILTGLYLYEPIESIEEQQEI